MLTFLLLLPTNFARNIKWPYITFQSMSINVNSNSNKMKNKIWIKTFNIKIVRLLQFKYVAVLNFSLIDFFPDLLLRLLSSSSSPSNFLSLLLMKHVLNTNFDSTHSALSDITCMEKNERKGARNFLFGDLLRLTFLYLHTVSCRISPVANLSSS